MILGKIWTWIHVFEFFWVRTTFYEFSIIKPDLVFLNVYLFYK